jgi:hypothetical protein
LKGEKKNASETKLLPLFRPEPSQPLITLDLGLLMDN